MVDVIKPICYISMPAHLPQASSSQLLKQSNTRCLHPPPSTPSSTTTSCETEDAADDLVQVVGRPSFSRSQDFPIANFPGGKGSTTSSFEKGLSSTSGLIVPRFAKKNTFPLEKALTSTSGLLPWRESTVSHC